MRVGRSDEKIQFEAQGIGKVMVMRETKAVRCRALERGKGDRRVNEVMKGFK